MVRMDVYSSAGDVRYSFLVQGIFHAHLTGDDSSILPDLVHAGWRHLEIRVPLEYFIAVKQ